MNNQINTNENITSNNSSTNGGAINTNSTVANTSGRSQSLAQQAQLLECLEKIDLILASQSRLERILVTQLGDSLEAIDANGVAITSSVSDASLNA